MFKLQTQRFVALILIVSFFTSSVALAVPPSATAGCSPNVRPALGVGDEEWDQYIQSQANFFTLSKMDGAAILKRNRQVLDQLREQPISDGKPTGKKLGFSSDELKDFYRRVTENPQVKESTCGRYNGSGEFGFCWGRAMAAHLLALDSGLKNQSIRKLWAVGPLKNGEQEWRYHVTTLVRGTDSEWYAIDPIFGEVLTADGWYAAMIKSYDPERKMRIFATDANRVSGESDAKYTRAELADQYYHNFFADLLDGIYFENTGKPGPWKRISVKTTAELQRKKLNRQLELIGMVGISSLIVVLMGYFAVRVLFPGEKE